MFHRYTAVVVMAFAVFAALEIPLDAQCAMCRTALENSPEGRGMASSFNNGILFLLAVPYALFGTVGVVIYRAHRRKKIAAQEAANPYIPHTDH